ncbi:MAG TPA: hypothetical protein VH643_02885 [Gemmataceae bacterium]|jgi:hypothetical protein
MATEEGSLDDVRAELLRLLNRDDWQITEEKARKPGRPILQAAGFLPTDGAMIEYIIRLLEDEALCREKFHEVTLGSGEKGYAMNDVDGKGLYVKLKINRDRREEVWVLSFHVSIHRGR